MKRIVTLFAVLCVGVLGAQTTTSREFDVYALQRLVRISDPQLSPAASEGV